MKTLQFWEVVNSVSNVMSVGVTCSGSGDSASAVMQRSKLIVDITKCSFLQTVTVNTPVKMRVTDVKAISTQDESDDSITVYNNTTAVTNVLAPAADKTFARATSIDDAQWEFDVGDDDLKLKAGEATACVIEVTLTGTQGIGNITVIGGLTKEVDLDNASPGTLTQAAADFVTNHAAAYSGEDITVTSSGAKIIFTADNDGVALDTPVFVNTSGDPADDLAITVVDATPHFAGRVILTVQPK